MLEEMRGTPGYVRGKHSKQREQQRPEAGTRAVWPRGSGPLLGGRAVEFSREGQQRRRWLVRNALKASALTSLKNLHGFF